MQMCQTHYWVIEAANGEKNSEGVCKNCGEVKKFTNYIVSEGYSWVNQKGAFRIKEDQYD